MPDSNPKETCFGGEGWRSFYVGNDCYGDLHVFDVAFTV